MDGKRPRSATLLAVGLAAALLAPSPALAQWYVGVYGGVVFPHEAEVTPTERLVQDIIDEAGESGVNVSFLSLGISDVEFDEGFMVGGRVGNWLQSVPFVGLEAEVYGAFPDVSGQTVTLDTTLTAGGASGSPTVTLPVEEADLDVLTVGLNVLGRIPLGAVEPYGGAGLGIVHAKLDDIKLPQGGTFTVDGTTFSYEGADVLIRNDDDTTAALQLKGGLRVYLAENVAIFGEYKWVTTELEFHSVELDYDASHAYGGIEVFFGPGLS